MTAGFLIAAYAAAFRDRKIVAAPPCEFISCFGRRSDSDHNHLRHMTPRRIDDVDGPLERLTPIGNPNHRVSLISLTVGRRQCDPYLVIPGTAFESHSAAWLDPRTRICHSGGRRMELIGLLRR